MKTQKINNEKIVNSVDSFTKIYLPKLYEQERIEKEKNSQGIGNYIAMMIIEGIKRDLRKSNLG